MASNNTIGDHFGSSVSISNNRIVVGAQSRSSGYAYIYNIIAAQIYYKEEQIWYLIILIQ